MSHLTPRPPLACIKNISNIILIIDLQLFQPRVLVKQANIQRRQIIVVNPSVAREYIRTCRACSGSARGWNSASVRSARLRTSALIRILFYLIFLSRAPAPALLINVQLSQRCVLVKQTRIQ